MLSNWHFFWIYNSLRGNFLPDWLWKSFQPQLGLWSWNFLNELDPLCGTLEWKKKPGSGLWVFLNMSVWVWVCVRVRERESKRYEGGSGWEIQHGHAGKRSYIKIVCVYVCVCDYIHKWLEWEWDWVRVCVCVCVWFLDRTRVSAWKRSIESVFECIKQREGRGMNTTVRVRDRINVHGWICWIHWVVACDKISWMIFEWVMQEREREREKGRTFCISACVQPNFEWQRVKEREREREREERQTGWIDFVPTTTYC